MTTNGNNSTAILDRQPPRSLEAERAVVGAILLRPDLADDLVGIVAAEDFHGSANATLYRALQSMNIAGQPIDIGLFVEQLKADGTLEEIGGQAYIAETMHSIPSAANALHHARIVRKNAQLRELNYIGTETSAAAHDPSTDVDQFVNRLERRLSAIADGSSEQNTINASAAVDAALELARERLTAKKPAGLATGLADVDQVIGGLFRGELNIVAGRPGDGKSALAIQCAKHAAMRMLRVLFVSLEMSAAELMARALCGLAQVDGNLLRNGRLIQQDINELEEAGEQLRGVPLFIEARSSASVPEIRRAARRIKSRGGLDLLVIDYLQFIAPENSRDTRELQVAKTSRQLKSIASELNVPVLCLAQLNRQAGAGKERPRLNHLRESGAIEQDADQVWLIYRPELHTPDDSDAKGKAELIVAKNRNGATGIFPLLFDGPTTSFRTPAHESRALDFDQCLLPEEVFP